jgi:hypothetical protein
MYVKPKEGFAIVDPDLRDKLPAEGREVPESNYWHRMVKYGDVTLSSPPIPSKAVPKPEKNSS